MKVTRTDWIVILCVIVAGILIAGFGMDLTDPVPTLFGVPL